MTPRCCNCKGKSQSIHARVEVDDVDEQLQVRVVGELRVQLPIPHDGGLVELK